MRAVDKWVRAALLERFRGFGLFPFRRRLSAHSADLLNGRLDTNPAQVVKPVGDLDALSTWLKASQADVLFENTSMNPHTGQPAIDYIRTALNAGIHTISATNVAFAQAGLTSFCGARISNF